MKFNKYSHLTSLLFILFSCNSSNYNVDFDYDSDSDYYKVTFEKAQEWAALKYEKNDI